MRVIFATTLLSTANAAWLLHFSSPGYSDLSSWYDFMSNNPYGFSSHHAPHDDDDEAANDNNGSANSNDADNAI